MNPKINICNYTFKCFMRPGHHGIHLCYDCRCDVWNKTVVALYSSINIIYICRECYKDFLIGKVFVKDGLFYKHNK